MKNSLIVLIVIVFSMVILGCNKKTNTQSKNSNKISKNTRSKKSVKPPTKTSITPQRALVKSSKVNVKSIAWGINILGDKLIVALGKLADSGKKDASLAHPSRNIIISPYSIASAFSLAWAGAKGETEKEFVKLFSSKLKNPQQHKALGMLQQDLAKAKGLKLSVANSLWMEKTMPIEKSYIENTFRYYGAKPFMVDYLNNANGAVKKINSWVEGKTNNRIKNLIPKGTLDKSTRAVLVNAIWFLAKWTAPFKKRNTRNVSFYPSPGYEIKVKTMYQKAFYRTTMSKDGESLTAIPYKGGRFIFMVYLPKKGRTLKEINIKSISKLTAMMKPALVKLYMPKTTLDNTHKLGKLMKNMGMPLSFSNKADFSGITKAKDGLKIDKVIHKTFLKVDEEGTEAAAATALVMATGAGAPRPVPEIKINRPFIFWIKDTKTGVNLFMGRIINPDPKSKITKLKVTPKTK
jgi:serine protease inhibitor